MASHVLAHVQAEEQQNEKAESSVSGLVSQEVGMLRGKTNGNKGQERIIHDVTHIKHSNTYI